MRFCQNKKAGRHKSDMVKRHSTLFCFPANMDVRPPASGHGCPYAGLTRPGIPKGRGLPALWSGWERLSEVTAVRGRGEAPRLDRPARSRLDSCFPSHCSGGQRPAGTLGAASPQSGSRRKPGVQATGWGPGDRLGSRRQAGVQATGWGEAPRRKSVA